MVRVLCRACGGAHCAAVRTAGKTQPGSCNMDFGRCCWIRLLVPFSVGQSAVSVENLVPAAEHRVYIWRSAAHSRLRRQNLKNRLQSPSAPTRAGRAGIGWFGFCHSRSEKKICVQLWLCGAGSGILLVSGLRPCIRLPPAARRAQQLSAAKHGCPAVFVSPAVGSPCLFGLLQPAIYLTPEADADETARRHCA